ncbi:MAG TPA: winged helix-turn-helix domain-containing protein [Candidatus Thermoplasmatota archaeon]|nr:winged helix-turn-helix domain-containing protein [Candidatus Thermoplasmatota archaeon]
MTVVSTAFTELFVGSPHARVLDFLAERPELDYTITQLAEGAGVARPTVYKVVRDFGSRGLLVPSRVVGNSRFYRLDRGSAAVRELLRIEPALATASRRRRRVARRS